MHNTDVLRPVISTRQIQRGTDVRTRLCFAGLDCVKRNGFARTTMSDIAKQAGIARPTLYKHFKSKIEIVFAGIDEVAFTFAESVVKHARQFDTLDDRIVETIIYVVQELPAHQYLSLVLDAECSEIFRSRAFSDEATLVFSEMTSAPLIELQPELKDQSLEIAQVMSLFAISMILFPGKYASDYDGLRGLIKRRVLPGLIA